MEIKTILCPTDFSAASDRTLKSAVALAKTLGARVKVVHVFQRPIGIALEGAPASTQAAETFLADAHRELREQLQALKDRWAALGVALEVELLEGAPAQTIAEQSQNVDLIMLATHGRSGFQRFLLGSVAERVVRTAECPVLTVPMTDEERKAP